MRLWVAMHGERNAPKLTLSELARLLGITDEEAQRLLCLAKENLDVSVTRGAQRRKGRWGAMTQLLLGASVVWSLLIFAQYSARALSGEPMWKEAWDTLLLSGAWSVFWMWYCRRPLRRWMQRVSEGAA